MLDHLKTRRSELQARGASLVASIGKLDALKARVANAEVALREHDADAADAMRQWAIEGGEGDPPASNHQARGDLLREVARAQADLQHAGDAHAQLSGEARDIAIALANVGSQIELAAIDALIVERAEELIAFETLIEKTVQPRLARLAALHMALADRGALHSNSGRNEQARAILQRAERLAVRPAIDYPEPAAIIAAAGAWADRLGELMGEPVASLQPEPEHVRLARERSFAEAEARARAPIEQATDGRVRANVPDPAFAEKPRLAEVAA